MPEQIVTVFDNVCFSVVMNMLHSFVSELTILQYKFDAKAEVVELQVTILVKLSPVQHNTMR